MQKKDKSEDISNFINIIKVFGPFRLFCLLRIGQLTHYHLISVELVGNLFFYL